MLRWRWIPVMSQRSARVCRAGRLTLARDSGQDSRMLLLVRADGLTPLISWAFVKHLRCCFLRIISDMCWHYRSPSAVNNSTDKSFQLISGNVNSQYRVLYRNLTRGRHRDWLSIGFYVHKFALLSFCTSAYWLVSSAGSSLIGFVILISRGEQIRGWEQTAFANIVFSNLGSFVNSNYQHCFLQPSQIPAKVLWFALLWVSNTWWQVAVGIE